MALFQTLGTGGVVSLVANPNGRNHDLKALNKVLLPHRFQKSGDIYGANDVADLLRDKATDTSLWPVYRKPALIVSDSGEHKVEHYRSLFQTMIDQYVGNLLEKGVMESYDVVTKETPLFDISRIYPSDGLERYSFPEIYFYEDDIDHLRNHGWEAFVPCLNRMAIRTNREQYLLIDVTETLLSERKYTVNVSSYSGNSRRWIKTAQIFVFVSFDEKDAGKPAHAGMAPVYKHVISSVGYEELLMDFIPDMGWDKRRTAMWYDVFGLCPFNQMCLVRLTPGRVVAEDPDIPDELKKDIVLAVNKKTDIPVLRKANGMTVANVSTPEDAMSLYRTQLETQLFLMFLKCVSAVNLELSKDPSATAALTIPTDGPRECVVGELPVRLPGPMSVRIPHVQEKEGGKEQ